MFLNMPTKQRAGSSVSSGLLISTPVLHTDLHRTCSTSAVPVVPHSVEMQKQSARTKFLPPRARVTGFIVLLHTPPMKCQVIWFIDCLNYHTVTEHAVFPSAILRSKLGVFS